MRKLPGKQAFSRARDYDFRPRMDARLYPRSAFPRFEVGRTLARGLCALLALVGLIPFVATALARSEPVRLWAARETAALIERLVGVDARYAVGIRLIPFALVVENIEVRASDGGAPAFVARRVSVTPRFFSLLAGQLDAGDVEIEEPHARVVIRDGKLTNVAYRLPKSEGPPPKIERAPFATLSLSDASVSLDIDGVRVETGAMDVDVFAEPGLVFETALRVGESRVVRERTTTTGEPAVDDDVLCELDARVRVEKKTALVRRLSVSASADENAAPGSFGNCKLGEGDPARVALRLSEVRVVLDDSQKPVLYDGHVVARAPLSLVNRVAKGPFRGWAGVVADVRYDPHADLPEVRGKVRGSGIDMAAYHFVKDFEADVDITGDEVRVSNLRGGYGHADVHADEVRIRPLVPGVPMRVHRFEAKNLRWEDLMENIDVTNDTIVQWNLDHVTVSDFGGTIDPLKLDGDVVAETTGFEVFDRSYRSTARKHMIGVHAATARMRFGVRPDQVQFMNSRVTFGGSEVLASVSVGFHNELWLSIGKGSKIDLADASPLVDIPMSGVAQVSASMAGIATTAELNGELSIDDFVFAGFPLGDVESSRVRFKPLVLDLSDVRASKGTTRFVVPTARLDFDKGDATMIADAQVKSDHLDLRDFFTMWHFEEDPRFDDIAGKGKVDARIHYDMGGKRDPCGQGNLRVDGNLALSTLDLFEEHYDSAAANFDFRWQDPAASYFGMQLEAPSVTLKKGPGTIFGSVNLNDGAAVRAHLVASGVPLAKIDAFGDLGGQLDAQASAVAEVSGTLDALVADVDTHIGPMRIGRATLPGSDVRVHLEPVSRPPHIVGKTQCGRPMVGPFDPTEYQADQSQGAFHAVGQFFGGQVSFTDLEITRQRHKSVRGDVAIHGLDLGAMGEMLPAVAGSGGRLDGRLSGTIGIKNFSTERPGFAEAAVKLTELRVGRKGLVVELEKPAALSAGKGELAISGVSIKVKTPTGESAIFEVGGSIEGLGREPKTDVTLTLRPTQLGAFARLLPQAERAGGTLGGSVRVTGTWPHLVQRGRFTLEHGELALRSVPVTLTDVDVAVGIEPDEIRILSGKATVGGGSVEIHGGMPIRGFGVGAARASITARDVNVPISEGVRMAADADLELGWQPHQDGERSLPKLTGDVTLKSFRYTRKVTVAADIDTLTKRGHRTSFESYDPENDMLELEVRIRASKPLEIDNDLVEAKLDIEDPGVILSGTNQRFGMKGQLGIVKGGRIRLRRNDFEITQGLVRFDDAERIAPRVDVTAVTDYTRYGDFSTSTSAGSQPSPSSSSGSGAGSAGGVGAGGRWRITMHAHGDPETLRIDLSSEPALSKDDIFLLLTLGLTRTELDRAQSATAGGSVALEALGRLTGADEAVKENIPVIDEFKLGSAYSSRTGRTEPTVTIGKRLAQRIRAYVTSGFTESREVRSNLEWRLSPRVSVEGSYDNRNDISSTTLGNLGADVRWRLEFE
jgi:translocation and assembly module TamB